MVDCYRCYRLQRIGNKVYCPFIDLPECHRGQHKFIHPKPEDIAKPERVKKVLQFSQSAKLGLCYKHRKYIIAALAEGKASIDVADELGLTKGAIDSFMTRLMDRNRVGCLSELKNWIVE